MTILCALAGVLLCGVGVGFNNCAGLGNDPVGILYDGMRSFFGMSSEQLGVASNIVNLMLLVLLIFTGRKYVSLGTVLYLVPYGSCVNLGTVIYHTLAAAENLPVQMAFAVSGCLLLCMGVALFITADIGVDPFTGIVLVLTDKLKKQYRFVKIGFDIALIIVGFCLGGRMGAVTLVTAVCVGPCIQFFHQVFVKLLVKQD